jgi:hypothetical protein
VGKVILDLGCCRNRDSKFFRTVEFNWHVKILMAHSMKPQEGKLMQLSQRMDALERQVSLLITMVSWLVKKHGGVFQIVGDKGASSFTKPSHHLPQHDVAQPPKVPPRFLLLMMDTLVTVFMFFYMGLSTVLVVFYNYTLGVLGNVENTNFCRHNFFCIFYSWLGFLLSKPIKWLEKNKHFTHMTILLIMYILLKYK